jgi:ribosomal protein L29
MSQAQQKVHAYELRKQDEPTLVQNLNKFRSELVGLRTSKVASAPQVKLARIRVRKINPFLGSTNLMR